MTHAFLFDKVFMPESKQEELFQDVGLTLPSPSSSASIDVLILSYSLRQPLPCWITLLPDSTLAASPMVKQGVGRRLGEKDEEREVGRRIENGND